MADFNDVWDICMLNGILRKQKYHEILERRALASGKKLRFLWKMVYKHFCDLCKLHLKKMQKSR